MQFAQLLTPLAAALALAALPLSADTALSVHTRLFALDAEARAAVRLNLDACPAPGQAAVQLIHAPATLQWGDSRLQLQGETITWSPVDRLPAGLKLIADTTLPVGPTGHALLRCIASAQYMERLPEGTFALRRIEADSPEVPRYVLTFQVERKDRGNADFAVSCRPEIAIARRREPLAGVQIPIGKPLVDVFTDSLSFTARKGQWQALLLRPPAPFAAGALVLISLDDAPVAPAAAGEPPRKRAREISMVIDATRTTTEPPLVRPSPDAPVGYLLYDGGFGLYGRSHGRPHAPPAGNIRAAWQDALAHAGYLPAAPSRPPRIVLLYHWGLIREVDDPPSENALIQEWGASRMPKVRGQAFVAITAYDQADFADGRQTLLWRVRAETGDVDNLREIIPALVTASTSWLGQGQKQRSTATVQLAAQRVVTQPPCDNDPAAARTVDEARIRALIEAEQRAITARHDFAVAPEDQVPHRPLPAGE